MTCLLKVISNRYRSNYSINNYYLKGYVNFIKFSYDTNGAMIILKEYSRALQYLEDLRCLEYQRYYDFRSVAKEYIKRSLEKRQ